MKQRHLVLVSLCVNVTRMSFKVLITQHLPLLVRSQYKNVADDAQPIQYPLTILLLLYGSASSMFIPQVSFCYFVVVFDSYLLTLMLHRISFFCTQDSIMRTVVVMVLMLSLTVSAEAGSHVNRLDCR